MKLLEIKNNLIKLSYDTEETPVLGRFLVLATNEKSYVAQFVNLKSDHVQNYAIAKLLFTFTPEGVVDDYDGSVPSIESEVSLLDAEELLDILPVETPIKIGPLTQQEKFLNIDISAFEHNFTVFAQRDVDKVSFISNCVRQLFQQKEKSVIIDCENSFAGYSKIKFTEDFKLPLNPEAIDFLFDYELADVEPSTKAVIQDIFYNVQEYIKTLEYEFLPIDNFVDVVSAQYKQTQMPELALLKNKLLKYRDENIFASSKEDFLALLKIMEEKNCLIIDINNVGDALQKLIIGFIHKKLVKFDKYVYLFVNLNDFNSDKKLIKSLLNNNHVFSTLIVNNEYKYSKELKAQAQNIVMFAPKELSSDLAPYTTFINKLNTGEAIVYGLLTHDIPFMVSIYDLDLPLTKDDVFGEKIRFVPVKENLQFVDSQGVQIEIKEPELVPEDVSENEPEYEETNTISIEEELEIPPKEDTSNVEEKEAEVSSEEILNEDFFSDLQESEPVYESVNSTDEPEETFQGEISINEEDDIVSVDEFGNEDLAKSEDIAQDMELTEDDLDFIDESSVIDVTDQTVDIEEAEKPPVVPVYPAEEENAETTFDFTQGDTVSHPKYGRGVVEKIIKYGNKTLCSISFDNVGRRLLDPSISEFEKV